MSRTAGRPALRPGEFIPLAALLMSLVALAIDTMLPALPAIGQDLGVSRRNDVQFIITALFLGLGLGQLALALSRTASDAGPRSMPASSCSWSDA